MTAPTPTVADVLEKAADLISAPGAWTQGVFARTENGGIVSPSSPLAVCYCMRGALYRASGRNLSDSLASLNKALGFSSEKEMTRWNDDIARTQNEVVAALRSAATLARESAK